MMMMAPEVVVVGAGPAGLAAAQVTSEAGVQTLLVDEYRQLGGQYFRQPASAHTCAPPTRQQAEGAQLIDAVRAAGPTIATETIAYAVEDGRLFLAQGTTAAQVQAPLILAVGATERVVPVPGWTLPGVVTCGAAQALAKAYGVPIGARVLVAGSGPFLWPVSAALVECGAQVAAVVEAQPLPIRVGLALAHSMARLREAAGYLVTLVKARVPLLFGHGVIRIDGDDAVASATVAPLTAAGELRPGPLRRFEVDAVALSDGFIPTIELGELAGVAVRFGSATRSYLLAVDWQTGTTSVPSVWAAGACVEELCSAALAVASGTLAGLTAVAALRGSLTPQQKRLRARALMSVHHQRRIAQYLAAAYPTRPAWYQRTTDDTIVCRCEEIRAGEIRAVAMAGAADVNLVKRWTRAGMGLCQGRTCQATISELVAATSRQHVQVVGRFRPRPPIRPVPLELFSST